VGTLVCLVPAQHYFWVNRRRDEDAGNVFETHSVCDLL
jgi:hypothetical protein